MVRYTISEINKGLSEAGYLSNAEINYAVSACINQNIPLIIEGDPGVGKTALSKAVAKMTGLDFLRVQFYEGLTQDKILYDFDYQKQLLTLTAIKDAINEQIRGKSLQESLNVMQDVNFYSEDFLIKRPILESLAGEKQYVLLLDEIDKSSEEIEYTLLEMLDEYAITIPEYGTVKCPEEKRPIVFLTSNRYRELSDALKRRCNYLYIPKKSRDEIEQILYMQAKVSDRIVNGVVNCMMKIRELGLKQEPSIAEGITWAQYLETMSAEDEHNLSKTICMLAKNEDDRKILLLSGIINEKLF